jgi:SAM-dependent methyltransferase
VTEALEAHLRRQIEHSRRFFWHRLRWRAVLDYLPEGPPLSLLDVGAGAGLCGEFLGRDRPQATYRFIEPIDSLGQMLRDRYGADADASGEVDHHRSDVVTLLDVLEHQPDDRAFMEDLVGRMRPGAVLLVTVPARQDLWSEWDVALGHFRRYDRESLLAVADGLPLTVIETSYLFPELVPMGMWRARRKAARPSGGDADDAEFPDLPGVVNDLLYAVGTASLSLRRRWPTGSSLFLAATVGAWDG